MRKKVLHSLLALVMGGVATLGCIGMTASSCNEKEPEKEPEHTHEYAEEWSSDSTSHWHDVLCGHTDAVTKQNHVYDDDNDADCNVCGYIREIETNKDPDEEKPGITDPDPDPEPEPTQTLTGKIYLVGDSTVCSFTDNYYMPRYGYGTQLYNYFNLEDENQIVNLALSGRSSLSFLTESNYKTLKDSISEGDYLIIGFGHNDEKNEEARFTDPVPDYQTESTAKGPSFQYNLYENYIKVAEEAGATPILCTPIVRYSSTANYDGSNAHITADGDYAQAIRDLGNATGTTVIDLTAITKADYTELGTAALNYHAHTSYDEIDGEKVPAGSDSTHLNYYGAKMVAYELVTALKNTDNTLKNYIKADIVKPTETADLAGAIKEGFTKPDYTQFDPTAYEDHYLGAVSGQSWYGTVMGDIGGSDKIPSYTVELEDGKFTVGNEVANGKFASTSYGFAAAFIQIDANKNFTASATIKIITCEKANNQSGFGLMIRDDIYIDTSDATIVSDCFAAGALVSTASSTKGAIFSYVDGKVVNPSSSNVADVVEGAVFTVTVEKTNNSFTVTFSDSEGTYEYLKSYPDFDVYAVDNDYVYLCLFANRGIVAEFSDVQFTITGDSQGA